MKEFLTDKNFVFILYNALAVGFVITSLEILTGRYLLPFYGTGLEVWSILLFTSMVGFCGGSLAGGYFSEKYKNLKSLGSLVIAASFYMLLISANAEGFLLWISANTESKIFGITISSIFLSLPVLVALGTYLPYAIRLSLKKVKSSGEKIGLLLSALTGGAACGILLTTILLIPILGVKITTLLISLLCFGSGLSCHIRHSNIKNRKKNGETTTKVEPKIIDSLDKIIGTPVLSKNIDNIMNKIAPDKPEQPMRKQIKMAAEKVEKDPEQLTLLAKK